jgi:hypothetical protein
VNLANRKTKIRLIKQYNINVLRCKFNVFTTIKTIVTYVEDNIKIFCGDEGGPRWCGGELVSMLELVCGGQYFGVLDRSKRKYFTHKTFLITIVIYFSPYPGSRSVDKS